MGGLRRLSCIALCALAPQIAAAQDAWSTGPENDPNSCRDLWETIGLPQYVGDGGQNTTLVCHSRYVLSHNNAAKMPDWVIERLTADQANGPNRRPSQIFRPEPAVAPTARAVDADYKGSGFDRGHQAPSADFRSNPDWMVESFILSNVVPQVGMGFNRGIWAELEKVVRNLALERGEVYVITGPVYPDRNGRTLIIEPNANACGNQIALMPQLPASICGPSTMDGGCSAGVTVPAALYKIVFDPGMRRVNAFILPNLDHRERKQGTDAASYLRSYQVSLKVAEQYTGLSFLPTLDARAKRVVADTCAAMMLH